MNKIIKHNILHKIKTGEVKMRSRIAIFGEKLGISGGIVMLFLGLIVIAGLLSYWFRLNNDLIFGGYGRYGLRMFIQTFPYVFVIAFTVLFFILSLVLRRFDYSYKKPFLAILSVIIGLVLVLGWFSLKTPYGRGFYQSNGRYLGMGRMTNIANMVSGEVTQIHGDMFIIETQNGSLISVKTSSHTYYPSGTPKTGDSIRAIGTWNADTFEAIGVRVFDKDDAVWMRGGYGVGRSMMRGQQRM